MKCNATKTQPTLKINKFTLCVADGAIEDVFEWQLSSCFCETPKIFKLMNDHVTWMLLLKTRNKSYVTCPAGETCKAAFGLLDGFSGSWKYFWYLPPTGG